MGDKVTYIDTYRADLQELLRLASAEAIAICRAWHGEHFGEPGWGGVDFVRMALRRAQQAVDTLDKKNAGIV